MTEGDKALAVAVDAKAIGEVYQRGKLSMLESMNILIGCGRMLIEAKQLYGDHGNWLPWLKANEDVLGFNRFTAARLMSAARKCVAATQLGEAEARAISRSMWGHSPGRLSATGDFEWYTPTEYVEMAREVLGGIDLDPASHEAAQRTVKAEKFYTKDDNGLTKEWHGRVFLNPPYCHPEMSHFVDKLLAERNAKRVKAAVLVSHNFTETGWFQKVAMRCQAICFTRGRIHFDRENSPPDGGGPANGQAFTYFGPDPQKFFDVFSAEGVVLFPDFLNRQTVAPDNNVVPVAPKVEESVKELFLGQALKRQKQHRTTRALKWRSQQR